jgi:hypothetical protein
MPMIEFSKKDLLRGKIVTPAWYRVMIEDVGENPSNDGKSTNYPVEGTIVCNADNGEKEFEGVPTPAGWMFNSKGIGFAVEFLKSLGVDVAAGTRYDLNAAKGMTIDVFIENGTYNGRLQNQINHKYRPAKSA